MAPANVNGRQFHQLVVPSFRKSAAGLRIVPRGRREAVDVLQVIGRAGQPGSHTPADPSPVELVRKVEAFQLALDVRKIDVQIQARQTLTLIPNLFAGCHAHGARGRKGGIKTGAASVRRSPGEAWAVPLRGEVADTSRAEKNPGAYGPFPPVGGGQFAASGYDEYRRSAPPRQEEKRTKCATRSRNTDPACAAKGRGRLRSSSRPAATPRPRRRPRGRWGRWAAEGRRRAPPSPRRRPAHRPRARRWPGPRPGPPRRGERCPRGSSAGRP